MELSPLSEFRRPRSSRAVWREKTVIFFISLCLSVLGRAEVMYTSHLDPVSQDVPHLKTLGAQPAPPASAGRARPAGPSALLLQL